MVLIRSIAERIWTALRARYGAHIVQVLLYGSYARGEATPDSDIDILVVAEDHLDPWQVRQSLDEVLLRILLEEDQLVSVLVVPRSLYEDHDSPFLKRVRQEGIPL